MFFDLVPYLHQMKKKRQYKPRTIDVENFNQLRNYAASMKVTEQMVKDAVSVVGNAYDDVKKHLGSYNNPYFYRKDRFHI